MQIWQAIQSLQTSLVSRGGSVVRDEATAYKSLERECGGLVQAQTLRQRGALTVGGKRGEWAEGRGGGEKWSESWDGGSIQTSFSKRWTLKTARETPPELSS